MFGSIDTTTGHCDQTNQRIVNYSSTNNCSQTNFITTSIFTDFNDSDYYNFNFDSDNLLDSSDASSPPPTPDIISSFASYAPDSPLSPMTPVYQNLSSPHYPLQSPTSSTSSMSINSPPNTIQETRKKLIKDSLRLTIQSRRMAMGLEDIGSNQLSSDGYNESDTTSPDIQLTVADEDRRRRRRERNKVAATKCRNKKKLHSVQLVQESESLETNNAQMRKEINDLQKECQQLMNLLNSHQPMCKKSINFNSYTTCMNYKDSSNHNNHNTHYNNSYYNINLQI